MSEISKISGQEPKAVNPKPKALVNQGISAAIEGKVDKKMMDELTKALFEALDSAKGKATIV